MDAAGPATDHRNCGDIRARVAGLGALAFVAVVVLQNLIRGGSASSNGASGEEVLAYYADHRVTTFVLVATFVLSGAGLAAFLGGAMFAVVVASEQALSVIAADDRPDLGAIEALWAFHHSAFTVLYLSLGIALVGLARAGVAAGLTPRAFERVAPVGAGLLAVGAIAGPAIAAGDAMPAFGLAGAGFLVWLAFLTSTGLRLVRSERSPA